MLNWRSRFASQRITWEQLVFQFVIVVLGVYLAIAFEGRAGDRARAEQAHDLLERVLEELKLDESHTREIMAGAEAQLVAFDSLLVSAGNDPQRHGDEIHVCFTDHSTPRPPYSRGERLIPPWFPAVS